jgi:hypothetical protein
MAIEITVTEAGIAALVNAANTGTDPVTITQIGLSQTAVVPNETLTALAGEFKRIDGVGGSVVAADTIHISAIDDSADAYTLRSFALYLGDGTLFAIYGQPSPILSKAEAAFVGLAIDVTFGDIDTALLEFGATDFLLPQATTEARGVMEIATVAEAQAGIDALRALTPASAKAAILGWLLAQDGAGSGLDADLLDGLQSTDFLRRGHGPRPLDFNHNGGIATIRASAGTWSIGYHFLGSAGADLGGFGCYGSSDARSFFYVGPAFNAPNTLKVGVSNISFNESFIWHAGNDGAGSGLDADLLDGLQATDFLRLNHGSRPFDYVNGSGSSFITANAGGWIMGHYFRGSGGTARGGFGAFGSSDALTYFFIGPDHASANALRILPDRPAWGSNVIWHAANDGAGSGLDADLLDGQHGSYYADIAARLGYTPLNTASYTAADVLAKLLTVDGAGSGVDADLLDGQHGSYYSNIPARLGYTPANKAGETFTGDVAMQNLTTNGNILLNAGNPAITLNVGGPRLFVQSVNRLSVNNDSTTRERIAIAAGGHVMVWGVRAPSGAVDIPGTGNIRMTPHAPGAVAASFYDTQGYTPCLFQRDSGGSATTVGSIISDLAGTSYNTSSDYRRKHVTGPVVDALARVRSTPVWRFYFTDDDAQREVDGFMAHEASASVPEAVHGEKDATEAIGTARLQQFDEDGTILIGQFEEMTDVTEGAAPGGWTWTQTGTRPVYQQIDQSKLVPLLWAALLELDAEVQALKTQGN